MIGALDPSASASPLAVFAAPALPFTRSAQDLATGLAGAVGLTAELLVVVGDDIVEVAGVDAAEAATADSEVVVDIGDDGDGVWVAGVDAVAEPVDEAAALDVGSTVVSD
jgi:hypothetical protein